MESSEYGNLESNLLVSVVVVGPGVVGLAVGWELALAGREALILEAEGAFGTQTPPRNSEVIHAGRSPLAAVRLRQADFPTGASGPGAVMA